MRVQSEIIQRLEDNEKRQNVLIHRLLDKIESLAPPPAPARRMVASQPTGRPDCPVPGSAPLRPSTAQSSRVAPPSSVELDAQTTSRAGQADTKLHHVPALRHGHDRPPALSQLGCRPPLPAFPPLRHLPPDGACGEHIALRPPGRRSPRAGKPGRAYNSVSSWPNAKYTESSLETVVPHLLSQANLPVTTLVIQSPTSDITNLQAVPEGDHKDLVLQSARNVVNTVERALAAHPSLRKAVILEQLPRKDSIHLFSLTHVYNSTLQQLVAASHNNSQLVVVGHPSLSPTTEAKTTAMFDRQPRQPP